MSTKKAETLLDEPLLRPDQVVERYGLSYGLLEDLRVARVGLGYFLFPDGIVRYQRQMVEAWLPVFEAYRLEATRTLCAGTPGGEFEARLDDPETREEALYEVDTLAMEQMERAR